MIEYNRFSMIPIVISGKESMARPVEFTADVVSGDRDKDGKYVTPSKASTTCHKCGGGFVFEVAFQGEPPYQAIKMDCPLCTPPAPVSPFINPLKSRSLNQEALDPLVNTNLLDGTISTKKSKNKAKPKKSKKSLVITKTDDLEELLNEVVPNTAAVETMSEQDLEQELADVVPAIDESDSFIDRITADDHADQKQEVPTTAATVEPIVEEPTPVVETKQPEKVEKLKGPEQVMTPEKQIEETKPIQRPPTQAKSPSIKDSTKNALNDIKDAFSVDAKPNHPGS